VKISSTEWLREQMARKSALLAGAPAGFRNLPAFVRDNWRSLAGSERRLGQLRNVCVVLLILLLSHASARFTWALFTPPPGIAPASAVVAPAAGQDARRNGAGVAAAAALGEKLAALHLFGKADPREITAAASAAATDAPETTLGLVLKGLLATTSSTRSLAVIGEKGKPGQEGVYGVGDTVPGNATIEAIFAKRVILRRAGRLEALFLEDKDAIPQGSPPPSSPPAPVEESRQISRQYVNNTLANLPELAKNIEAHIHRPEDGRQGILLVAPGGHELLDSAFQKNIGLQAGDILYEINGIPLTDPSAALSAFEKLRDARAISVVFERNGVERNMTLAIR